MRWTKGTEPLDTAVVSALFNLSWGIVKLIEKEVSDNDRKGLCANRDRSGEGQKGC